MTVEIDVEGPLQPWLGMPGHLIVRSEDGAYLAHAHGASALRFALTLPDPGRYCTRRRIIQPRQTHAEKDLFSMDGVWELSVTLSGTQGQEVINLSTVVTSAR
ncbi:hypothetical protein [Nonomuraea sp. GTA35]|uniref:hypothetical protein n=1 Tax=Nonomuraea sp. GTA35 TaxID=1676746 RepID=UPI0035BFDF92